MYDLKKLFAVLGLPLGLVAVIAAILLWAGVDVEKAAWIAGGLAGLQLLGAFLVDALKYAGVVSAGDSGKWSAGYNLITLVGVVVWLKFFPSFDLHGFDGKVLELAQLLFVIFAYITQIVGTKRIHVAAAGAGVTYQF